MEDEGESFETGDQEPNYGIASDVLQAFGSNFGPEEAGANSGISTGTVVPEHAIRIPDNERQKSVIISRSSEWSKLKVPAPMFEADKGAFVPKIVSIGPFYHNEPSLRAMQTHKRRFLDRLIRNRTGQPILVESLKNAMSEMEKYTRGFYAYDFQDIEPGDFVQMMLLDGCFIVELLRLHERKHDHEEEPIFETRWMLSNISRDLLLLENQLPMAVLRKIFELTTFTGEASLNTIALSFFEPSIPGKKELAKLTLDNHVDGKYDIHLLALFHFSLTSGQPVKSEERKGKTKLELPGKGWVHNAEKLRYAGITFKTNSGSFLDINFNGKTLSIPTMIIDDGTGPLLRNLIAYEQNNRHAAPHFCCLAVFLDSIVDTVEDVKILRGARIIQQSKGGDVEVVNLFNSLTKELVFDIDADHCKITEQIKRINRVCRAHDTRVKIRLFLAKLNYRRVPEDIFRLLITVIFILFYIKFENPNYLNSPPPPPQPS